MKNKYKLMLFLFVMISIILTYYGDRFSQFCLDNKEFYGNSINGKILNVTIENNRMREVNKITILIGKGQKNISYTYYRSQADNNFLKIGDSLAKRSGTFVADLFRKDSLIALFNESDHCYYCK